MARPLWPPSSCSPGAGSPAPPTPPWPASTFARSAAATPRSTSPRSSSRRPRKSGAARGGWPFTSPLSCTSFIASSKRPSRPCSRRRGGRWRASCCKRRRATTCEVRGEEGWGWLPFARTALFPPYRIAACGTLHTLFPVSREHTCSDPLVGLDGERSGAAAVAAARASLPASHLPARATAAPGAPPPPPLQWRRRRRRPCLAAGTAASARRRCSSSSSKAPPSP